MKIWTLKTGAGFALILLALILTLTANSYQDQPSLAVWLYVIAIGLFGIGFPLGLDLRFKDLLKKSPVQSYTLSRGKLLIHYECTMPVYLIGSNGHMVVALIEEGCKLRIRDAQPGGTDLLLTSGSLENIKFAAGTLTITLEPMTGYRINWNEFETWEVQ